MKTAIVGLGAAGQLAAHILKDVFKNQIDLHLFESEEALATDKTWCLHEADIPSPIADSVKSLLSGSWSRYQVKFPKYNRMLQSNYHGIRSRDLAQLTTSRFAGQLNLAQAKDPSTLQDYEIVLDCRGWGASVPTESSGYQKFVGLEIVTEHPHGLQEALLMDVQNVEQIDGFRFFYLLPWSANQILVEDTYYSRNSQLNKALVEQRILEYWQNSSWAKRSGSFQILHRESGVLTIPLVPFPKQGDALGARSGLFQSVTGYTLPETLKSIAALSLLPELNAESVQKALSLRQREFTQHESYYLFMNQMMFEAAIDHDRYRVLEHYYQKPQAMIERFYAGDPTTSDKIRTFLGWQAPVSVTRAAKVAIKAIFD